MLISFIKQKVSSTADSIKSYHTESLLFQILNLNALPVGRREGTTTWLSKWNTVILAKMRKGSDAFSGTLG